MKRYLPERYHESGSLFDAFDSLFKPVFFDEVRDMRTDIRDTENGYVLDIEMPGYKKDSIKVALEDGYLNVSASKKTENSKDSKYLRKEISETIQRSYYVGDDISEESVRAKYEDGILRLSVPKSKPKQITSRSINIE